MNWEFTIDLWELSLQLNKIVFDIDAMYVCASIEIYLQVSSRCQSLIYWMGIRAVMIPLPSDLSDLDQRFHYIVLCITLMCVGTVLWLNVVVF